MWVRGESAGTQASAQRKHEKDEVQRRSEDAIDAHQGESSEAGADVEEFQFKFRFSLQGQCTKAHSKEPLLLKMCTKSDGHVWPCRFSLDLYELLCPRTGTPMPYIVSRLYGTSGLFAVVAVQILCA